MARSSLDCRPSSIHATGGELRELLLGVVERSGGTVDDLPQYEMDVRGTAGELLLTFVAARRRRR